MESIDRLSGLLKDTAQALQKAKNLPAKIEQELSEKENHILKLMEKIGGCHKELQDIKDVIQEYKGILGVEKAANERAIEEANSEAGERISAIRLACKAEVDTIKKAAQAEARKINAALAKKKDKYMASIKEFQAIESDAEANAVKAETRYRLTREKLDKLKNSI